MQLILYKKINKNKGHNVVLFILIYVLWNKKENEKLYEEYNLKIIEIIYLDDFLYLMMDLYYINLKEYLEIREKLLSINEIKELLIKINKTLKELKNKNINIENINFSNFLDKINKISIKINNYNL